MEQLEKVLLQKKKLKDIFLTHIYLKFQVK
jgi:hypothetical protein